MFADWKKKSQKKKSSLFALIFFIICTIFFYLGNSAFSCSDTLAMGPGDQTSGLIWLNSTVNAPLWGHTDVSNAPFGESLRSPVYATGLLQYFIYWIASLSVGPVCGYNLYTSIGFVFSAMIVFFFIRNFTKRTDVAIFAGFAATFTPYLQIKTGVHPSYVFYGVFVLAAWQMIRIYKEPTFKKAVILGLISSTFFFIDPYFILLGAITIFSTAIGLLLYSLYNLYKYRNKKPQFRKLLIQLKDFVKKLLISGVVVCIFAILPLMFVKLKYNDQIKAEVSSVRSDIRQEAFTYAARPSEYLLPNLQNPYIGTLFVGGMPDVLTRKPHGTNPAENTLSLSLAVLILSILGIALTISRRLRSRLKIEKFSKDYPILATVFSVTATAALITSFPPTSHGVTFPTEVIVKFIDIWRVFARLQVVVVFSIVVLAAIGITMLTSRLSKSLRILITILLVIIVAFEYLTFTPLKDNRAWSYESVHPFYSWLKTQKDVQLIAEYPLNESGQTAVSTAYFTAQYVHKKHLINAARSASPQAVLRNSLRDVTDPQTPSALASLGVDLIVVHAEDRKPMPDNIPGLQLVDWNGSLNDPDSIYVNGKMWVYKVTAQPDSDNMIVAPSVGFNELRFNSTYTMAEYGFNKQANLAVINLKSGILIKPNQIYTLTFNAVSTDKPTQLMIMQNGKNIWQGEITKTKQPVELQVSGRYPITLKKITQQKSGEILLSELNLLQ